MILVLLALLGLAAGSFCSALVWRLHQQTQKTSKNDTSKQNELSILRGRSMCPHCKHRLQPLDLVPLLSWVGLKGRCRYCKKPVSWHYPATELVTAGLFVVSYLHWPLNLEGVATSLFGIWLVIVTLSVALAIYDLKWMVLPNRLIYALASLVGAWLVVYVALQADPSLLFEAGIGSLAFGGLFYILYQVSNGKWIGGGDVRLGFILGLLLGWQKSLLALTLAAYLGTAVVLLLVLMRRYRRNLKLPFGPFLLTASFAAVLWGQDWIEWYLRLSGL